MLNVLGLLHRGRRGLVCRPVCRLLATCIYIYIYIHIYIYIYNIYIYIYWYATTCSCCLLVLPPLAPCLLVLPPLAPPSARARSIIIVCPNDDYKKEKTSGFIIISSSSSICGLRVLLLRVCVRNRRLIVRHIIKTIKPDMLEQYNTMLYYLIA